MMNITACGWQEGRGSAQGQSDHRECVFVGARRQHMDIITWMNTEIESTDDVNVNAGTCERVGISWRRVSAFGEH